MRHWRQALQQIYDHHANKVIPGYGPQSDTEKALFEAIKQLELQCKERIDLLEALRASRQDGDAPDRTPRPSDTDYNPNRAHKGTIGLGTIPAVTYSELSRPTPSPRQSISTLPADVPTANSDSPDRLAAPAKHGRSRSPSTASRNERTLRNASPEKHTMRTTLRPTRNGEKSSTPARKTQKPAAEGSSKAASLAWSALGSRDKTIRTSASEPIDQLPIRHAPPPQSKYRRPYYQSEGQSKRLVSSKEDLSSSSTPLSAGRGAEGQASQNTSLSLSAASSALNYTATGDDHTRDTGQSRRTAFTRRSPKGDLSPSSGTGDEGTTKDSKLNSMDTVVRRKAIARRAAAASIVNSSEPESPGLSRNRATRAQPRPALTSSEDETNADRRGSQQRISLTKDKAEKKAGNSKRMARQRTDASPVGFDVDSTNESGLDDSSDDVAWKKKKASILQSLPPGVDESAAKQILNDIIVQGDEVRWSDIAGLEIAKTALRETVVYPFLRPDLFMGLREPARGMLLFGPPGTGKTMLARAVATESKSTFFSISASSLTSKYLGESEKLVRALFGLARSLAPSIIFVDEIDSLLSQRSGSGEHEATRRIKTEFLIQWSDLQRAAAGRETTERDKERGDANRVLVLAATNLPWAIDEAARRRFVRRQYIPLPEPSTRETQFRTLLGQQKHALSEADVNQLVELTEGESYSTDPTTQFNHS